MTTRMPEASKTLMLPRRGQRSRRLEATLSVGSGCERRVGTTLRRALILRDVLTGSGGHFPQLSASWIDLDRSKKSAKLRDQISFVPEIIYNNAIKIRNGKLI
jgi:hypothetical protein